VKIIDIKSKLKLKNSGKLEMVFLGTGTAFSQSMYNNNIIIIKGDTHILVDFGYTAPLALEKHTGLSPLDIEAFLPTHSHADHIGGVEYLVLYNRYVGTQVMNKPKLKLITTKQYQRVLWNNSLRGGLEWNELSEGGKMQLEDYFDIILAEPVPHRKRSKYIVNYEGISLELFGTNHIPDSARTQKQAFLSYGLMIDNRIMYTSDTKFDTDLLEIYADRAEVIFHDCSTKKNPVHTSIEELVTIPDKWKKKIIMMHYNDENIEAQKNGFQGVARHGVRYIFD
jgi:ribonuclease BN (tRNA processing enzyme)